jgi:hypothetical protein
MTIEEVVAAYIRDCRPAALREMRIFAIQHALEDAVRYAALCLLPSGKRHSHWKRHSHQRRIPIAVLEEAERRLQLVPDELTKARDFAALHQVVEGKIRLIRGIGALTVYDVAHRISAFLGKPPDLVYLHAGTRVGAATLGFKGDVLDPDELPAAFGALTAAEIEDCLCIYKKSAPRWWISHRGFSTVNRLLPLGTPLRAKLV